MTEQSQLDGWPAFVRPTLFVLGDSETWRTSDLFELLPISYLH